MKSYDFALSATIPSITMQVQGNAFYYVNGTSAGLSTLTIKPERGEDFDLKPGQSVRFPQNIGTWYVKSKDGSSVITGQLMIGDGIFADSNIFSTTVIAPGQTVGITGLVRDIYRPEGMTGSYATTASQAAGTAAVVVAPGANVSGVIVHNAHLLWTGTGRQSFLAKTSAPTSVFDGDVILSHDTSGGTGTYGQRDLMLQNSVLVPAGKGIYLFAVGDPSGFYRGMNYTVLP